MRGVKREFVRPSCVRTRLAPIFEPEHTRGHAPASTRKLGRIMIGRGARRDAGADFHTFQCHELDGAAWPKYVIQIPGAVRAQSSLSEGLWTGLHVGFVHHGVALQVRDQEPVAIQKGTRVLISLWDSLMFGRVPGAGSFGSGGRIDGPINFQGRRVFNFQGRH